MEFSLRRENLQRSCLQRGARGMWTANFNWMDGQTARVRGRMERAWMLHHVTPGESIVNQNVLIAIREGMWDYEPPVLEPGDYDSTKAMPGTKEKIAALAERAEMGLPLWHDYDRLEYDDEERR